MCCVRARDLRRTHKQHTAHPQMESAGGAFESYPSHNDDYMRGSVRAQANFGEFDGMSTARRRSNEGWSRDHFS